MGNLFKDIGKGIKHGTKSVGHLLEGGEKKIEGAVNSIYKDGKSAVSTVYNDTTGAIGYGGKHLINDVDGLSSSFSNSFVIIGVGVAIGAALLLSRQ